jgi:signal transduction histidine kinase
LIAKEAINNIAKYSNATNAVINLSKQNNSVVLVIKDDGDGFDIVHCKKGNGLHNMDTRARSMNGQTDIASLPMNGTTITATMPLTNISDREV